MFNDFDFKNIDQRFIVKFNEFIIFCIKEEIFYFFNTLLKIITFDFTLWDSGNNVINYFLAIVYGLSYNLLFFIILLFSL